MKSYFLEEFKDKESYTRFVRYMLSKSDTFSLVYFKHFENEKVKNSVKEVKKLLNLYKIFSFKGNQWPGTVTFNEQNHIYNITLYNSNINAEKALLKAEKLFDWDYPFLPMDLCFYKKGYAWLCSCSHERFAYVYIEDKKTYLELENLGAKLHYESDIEDSKLFLETSLKEIANRTGDGSR